MLPGSRELPGARREQKIYPRRSRPKLDESIRKDEINSFMCLLTPGEPVLRRYRGFLRRPHPTQFFRGFVLPACSRPGSSGGSRVLPLPPEQMIILIIILLVIFLSPCYFYVPETRPFLPRLLFLLHVNLPNLVCLVIFVCYFFSPVCFFLRPLGLQITSLHRTHTYFFTLFFLYSFETCLFLFL